MNIKTASETCLYVNDIVAAERFYRVVIKLTTSYRVTDQYVVFHYGDGALILFQSENRQSSAYNLYEPGHVSFDINTTEISMWEEHLRQHNVPVETEVIWPTGRHSIYFRDPAGNRVELMTGNKVGAGVGQGKSNLPSNGISAKWKLYHAAKVGAQ